MTRCILGCLVEVLEKAIVVVDGLADVDEVGGAFSDVDDSVDTVICVGGQLGGGSSREEGDEAGVSTIVAVAMADVSLVGAGGETVLERCWNSG